MKLAFYLAHICYDLSKYYLWFSINWILELSYWRRKRRSVCTRLWTELTSWANLQALQCCMHRDYRHFSTYGKFVIESFQFSLNNVKFHKPTIILSMGLGEVVSLVTSDFFLSPLNPIFVLIRSPLTQSNKYFFGGKNWNSIGRQTRHSPTLIPNDVFFYSENKLTIYPRSIRVYH